MRIFYVAVPIVGGTEIRGAVRITFPTSSVDARVRRVWVVLGALAVFVLSVAAALAYAKTRPDSVPTDELIVVSMCVGVGVAFLLASANKVLKLGLLSRIAERVTFVLIPPLLLIFLVLGTIFLGVATPTEGGAMGAMGAIIIAFLRRRLSFDLLKQAVTTTTKLSCFVMFILIGSTVFSFTFNAADGHIWVEHLFDKLPGGQLGFILFVTALVFVLGMFIDFFEIAFIVVPLLAPVAEKLGIDLIWFGVLLGVNMQTSFMHPPFGFALFYLRSVAPTQDYKDRVTGRQVAQVTTGQIYWGAVPFVCIQIIMIGLVIGFPGMVSGGLDRKAEVDTSNVILEVQPPDEPKKDVNMNQLFGLPEAASAASK
jgi:TRAP-type mannitol/chloroaromatic compound transport system permease large subunit